MDGENDDDENGDLTHTEWRKYEAEKCGWA